MGRYDTSPQVYKSDAFGPLFLHQIHLLIGMEMRQEEKERTAAAAASTKH